MVKNCLWNDCIHVKVLQPGMAISPLLLFAKMLCAELKFDFLQAVSILFGENQYKINVLVYFFVFFF